MPEGGLDKENVLRSLVELHGERVPQGMGRSPSAFRLLKPQGQPPSSVPGRERMAFPAWEQRTSTAPVKVSTKMLRDAGPKEHNLDLAPLGGPHDEFAALQVHVSGIESQRGSEPEPRGEHEREEGVITPRRPPTAVRQDLQQPPLFVLRDSSGR